MKTKKLIALLTTVIITIQVLSQSEHRVTLSGGYAFAKVDETFIYNVVNVDATGYRINGLYEFIPDGQPVAYGFLVGYSNIEGSQVISGQTIKATIYTVPVVFSPKFLIGEGRFKGFVKGDLGLTFSGIKRTGGLTELKSDEVDFIIGGAAGLMFDITDHFFINAEYQIDFITDGYYDGGWLNSPMFGIGWKF